jgi:hypothetical protein
MRRLLGTSSRVAWLEDKAERENIQDFTINRGIWMRFFEIPRGGWFYASAVKCEGFLLRVLGQHRNVDSGRVVQLLRLHRGCKIGK